MKDDWQPFDWQPAIIPPDWPRLYKESLILPARGTTMVRHKWDYWKVEIEGDTLKEYVLGGLGPNREGRWEIMYILDQVYPIKRKPFWRRATDWIKRSAK